ncbi:MAG: hypothetical protein ACTS4U_00760 [Candidatus Hodgkinia cicadicola]
MNARSICREDVSSLGLNPSCSLPLFSSFLLLPLLVCLSLNLSIDITI